MEVRPWPYTFGGSTALRALARTMWRRHSSTKFISDGKEIIHNVMFITSLRHSSPRLPRKWKTEAFAGLFSPRLCLSRLVYVLSLIVTGHHRSQIFVGDTGKATPTKLRRDSHKPSKAKPVI